MEVQQLLQSASSLRHLELDAGRIVSPAFNTTKALNRTLLTLRTLVFREVRLASFWSLVEELVDLRVLQTLELWWCSGLEPLASLATLHSSMAIQKLICHTIHELDVSVLEPLIRACCGLKSISLAAPTFNKCLDPDVFEAAQLEEIALVSSNVSLSPDLRVDVVSGAIADFWLTLKCRHATVRSVKLILPSTEPSTVDTVNAGLFERLFQSFSSISDVLIIHCHHTGLMDQPRQDMNARLPALRVFDHFDIGVEVWNDIVFTYYTVGKGNCARDSVFFLKTTGELCCIAGWPEGVICVSPEIAFHPDRARRPELLTRHLSIGMHR